MSVTNRRGFLVRAAALPLLTTPLLAKPLTKSNLGVQLYTVRNQLPSDPAGVLKKIRDIGYTELEATDYGNSDEVWKAIASCGLKPTSVHMNAPMLHWEADRSKARLAQFKQWGFSYVVFPYLAQNDRGGADVYKNLAADLNTFGKLVHQNGMQLCYHNHAFEFESMGGTTPLQILLGNTDKQNLAWEMDIFWVTVAGNNPVDLLKTYAGRVPLLHVKDKAKGVPAATQYNENVPKDAFKEAGNGSIDIPAVLQAANQAGVQNYFVEQDQSPDPLKSLAESYRYLSGHFSS